jgi:thiol-disulfide isomerase/thioredoxin
MKRRPFLQKFATALSSLIVGMASRASAAWKEGATMPALSSFDLAGKLPNTSGKVVYLDFWASWCAPCKASFPVLSKWQHDYAARGFTVLGISVDEDAAAMRAFLSKNNPGFPTVHDSAHKLVASADVTTMPTSFLIDRKGRIRHVHSGFHAKDEATLAAQIERLLAES